MQTIGIRIVYAQNESAVGHMYVVFKGADGTTQSFGHYPQSAIDSGGGRGEVRTTDIQRESSPFPPGTGGVPDVPRDFPVSPGDYQRALDYARDAVNQKGDITNKWGYYGPITRSCIDFTTNNFHSEFTDNPVVTASAALLPQMQGAGFVRDMREAMSLGTATAQTLEQTITSFKSATTTQDRQALVDQVTTAWASTSSLGDAKTRNPVSTALLSSGGGNWYVGSPAQAIADFARNQPAIYAQLSVLERSNGQPVIERYTRATNASYYDAVSGTYKGYTYYTVSIEQPRIDFFQAAYDSLKASTYQSLYLQTEGRPHR